MKELKCPKCGSTFTVDEADYALLLSQVKNSEFEAELARRMHDLEQMQQARQQAERQAAQAQQQAEQSRREQQFNEQLTAERTRLVELKNQLAQADQQKQLAVAQVRQQATEAYMKKEQELATLRTQMEAQLKAAQEQIAYYKDMKIRLSTKMVGETLEQHCANEFARIRPYFPNAYFEKDNEVVEGTKGDFVFRDSSDDGVEYISIMFEMKNENDETNPVTGLSEQYRALAAGTILGIPVLAVFLIVVIAVCSFVATKTVYGRRVYSCGGNIQAARVAGINTSFIRVSTFAIAGLLAGLCGFLMTSRVTIGQPTAGESYEMDAITACVVGGVSMSGGVGKPWGVIIGTLLITVIANGLDILGVSAYWQKIVKGLIIVGAVLIDVKGKGRKN